MQVRFASAEWILARCRARDLVRTALVDNPDYTFEKAQQFAFIAIEGGPIVGLGVREELVLEAIRDLRPEDVGRRPMLVELR